MSTVFQDLRFAFRSLRKAPACSCVAVVTLALGIGASTVVFSSMYGLLYRPPPFDEEDRLLVIQGNYTHQSWQEAFCSYPNFLDMKEQCRTVEGLAAYKYVNLNVTGGDQPERVTAMKVTASVFPVIDVQPIVGRVFNADEDRPGAANVVLLGDSFWRARHGGDPGIIGRDLTIHNDVYTVIGVMPPDIEAFLGHAGVWMPLAGSAKALDRRDNDLRIIGRRKPGASMSEVETELQMIMRRLEVAFPDANTGRGVRPTTIRRNRLNEETTLAIKSLTVAVAAVLLIACCNVANLMLARGASRATEMALRAALGARPGRLVRQLLTESAVLALLGGALGIVLASWGIDLLIASFEKTPKPTVRIDVLALVFALITSLATAVIFGLLPARRASCTGLSEALKQGSRTARVGSPRDRLRGLLVVGEIALAITLVVATGLMIQTVFRLHKADPGFNPRGLLTMHVSLAGYNYENPTRQRAFFREVLAELELIPNTTFAAAADCPPLHLAAGVDFSIEGRPFEDPDRQRWVGRLVVTPDYWKTMQIPLAAGRVLLESDDVDTPAVAVINETLARQFWPGANPIGQRVKFEASDDSTHPWRRIVGVVEDNRHRSLRAEPRGEVFVPYEQMPRAEMVILVRTTGDNPESLAGAVREAVWRVDPDQPVFTIRSMEDRLQGRILPWRVYAGVLTVFSAIALALAAVGVYSVMSYMVSQRTHEIGVRMAFGARSDNVLGLVLRRGVMLILIGVGIGLVGALGIVRLISSLLYGVAATHVPTFAGVVALLALVALLACYIPARRATKVDPIVALRYE
ncbi:MAG: ABC transporter permease [Phycisphaerales bacterium]|nr:MAG: ABC transporter permease [Phycisphaerales bacterium]